MNSKLMLIASNWDGEGELNQIPGAVSDFMGTIIQSSGWRTKMQSFVDENFTPANPIAMYSRSLVYWGEPLDVSEETGSINTNDISSENLMKKY